MYLLRVRHPPATASPAKAGGVRYINSGVCVCDVDWIYGHVKKKSPKTHQPATHVNS